MQNITFEQWEREAERLRADAAVKWPLLTADHGGFGYLRFTNGSFSATLDLQFADGPLRPEMRIGSSGCVSGKGTVADMTEHARCAVEMRDAMSWAESCVRGILVWMRDCPCSFCSGRGKDRGVDCKHCNGTGKVN